eukprot:2391068-Alexandrium_andersonii.AAC.1
MLADPLVVLRVQRADRARRGLAAEASGDAFPKRCERAIALRPGWGTEDWGPRHAESRVDPHRFE